MLPVGLAWHERDRLRLSECRRRHTNYPCGEGTPAAGDFGRSTSCARAGRRVCATCALIIHVAECDSEFVRTWPWRSKAGRACMAMK
jgi:hypothetical protein